MSKEFPYFESQWRMVEGGRIVAYSAAMSTPSTSKRVRDRLREELKARGITQRELADALSKNTDEYWTQSRVAKVLGGHVELKVDDADAIAKVAGIFLTEAVRDRGLEFYAEMTPSELRILEKLRQRPGVLHGVMLILGVPTAPDPPAPVRPRRKVGRPLLSASAKV